MEPKSKSLKLDLAPLFLRFLWRHRHSQWTLQFDHRTWSIYPQDEKLSESGEQAERGEALRVIEVSKQG